MSTIGIDVSTAKLDCLWIRSLPTMKVKSKVQANTPTGHKALLEWAMKQTGDQVNELHFVMEATGIYHEALAYALHDAGAQVSVVNPAWIRSYAKSLGSVSKNDKKDSVGLFQYEMILNGGRVSNTK